MGKSTLTRSSSNFFMKPASIRFCPHPQWHRSSWALKCFVSIFYPYRSARPAVARCKDGLCLRLHSGCGHGDNDPRSSPHVCRKVMRQQGCGRGCRTDSTPLICHTSGQIPNVLRLPFTPTAGEVGRFGSPK